MKDFRDATNIAVLTEQERVQYVIDKMIIHRIYCDIEYMPAAYLKETLTDLVTVSGTITYCPAYDKVLAYVERLIDENDSYVEAWDGAGDDLQFMYDVIKERSFTAKYKETQKIYVTLK